MTATTTTTTAAETPDNNKKQIEVVIEKSKKVDTNNAFAAITAAADNNEDDDVEDIASLSVGGIFRGVAAAARTKAVLAKTAVRTIGGTRSLAFASEGAVAGAKIMPSWMFYGAWSISGLAIAADITTRTWDAPPDKEKETALYWTVFHIPASLVVPAVIIHKIVHTVEHALENPPKKSSTPFSFSSLVKHIPIRYQPFIPVGAAMLSIIPVVPAVDYTAEIIMEPTLGNYLGLEFHHHHHHQDAHDEKDNDKKKEL